MTRIGAECFALNQVRCGGCDWCLNQESRKAGRWQHLQKRASTGGATPSRLAAAMERWSVVVCGRHSCLPGRGTGSAGGAPLALPCSILSILSIAFDCSRLHSIAFDQSDRSDLSDLSDLPDGSALAGSGRRCRQNAGSRTRTRTRTRTIHPHPARISYTARYRTISIVRWMRSSTIQKTLPVSAGGMLTRPSVRLPG